MFFLDFFLLLLFFHLLDEVFSLLLLLLSLAVFFGLVFAIEVGAAGDVGAVLGVRVVDNFPRPFHLILILRIKSAE